MFVVARFKPETPPLVGNEMKNLGPRHGDALLEAADVLVDEVAHDQELDELHAHDPVANELLDGVVPYGPSLYRTRVSLLSRLLLLRIGHIDPRAEGRTDANSKERDGVTWPSLPTRRKGSVQSAIEASTTIWHGVRRSLQTICNEKSQDLMHVLFHLI